MSSATDTELTFDTTLTFDDVWRSLQSEWLPEDLRALICRTIVRLPASIAEFASRNCSFISLGDDGQTFPASLFTHLTQRGRTMRKHWVINLKSSLVENESKGQYVIAHEIAHAWVGSEKHADIAVKLWGFQIPQGG
jgi:hypothetical protein